MAANIRGVVPLQFGTVVTTGYVTDSTSENVSGKEVLIDDEVGDIKGHITGFGIMTETTLEVMPKSTGASQPAPGDIFSWGPTGGVKKIEVDKCEVKSTKGGVQTWTITGKAFPGITLT